MWHKGVVFLKDIPIFETEYGVASLTLRNIPWRQDAFIRILSSLEPEGLIRECAGFCRACGAERIFVSGDGVPKEFTLHATLLTMRRSSEQMEKSDAALFPVTEQTAEEFRSLYNTHMHKVPNAAFMSSEDAKEMLCKGDGYFVHRNGALLGLGRVSDGAIDVVIAVKPGAGKDVVCALAELITEDTITMTVAAENLPAMRLYEKLGFIPVAEVSRWYCVK
jgi:hypothetical protein